MTKEAAITLSNAQKKFLEKGYLIVIYDAYRPSSSVKSFVEWMKDENTLLFIILLKYLDIKYLN